MHPGFSSLAGALEWLQTNKLSNRRKRQIQMASVGPTPCSGLKSDIASPIPQAHFETVLNMSPDAFATEARVVTQVARAGSDVFRLRIEADGRQYAPRPPGKGTACSRSISALAMGCRVANRTDRGTLRCQTRLQVGSGPPSSASPRPSRNPVALISRRGFLIVHRCAGRRDHLRPS